ncbi:MAG: hypothetical protein ACE5IR_16970 [bacterium]
MINTLKIFDQLQSALDPAAAKAIAEVLGVIYEDLQNTVTKTEFNDLKNIVKELADAQKKTEKELHAVALDLRELTKEHRKTREQVGGLSNTVGYILENEAFKALPALLKRDYGLTIKGRLKRQFVRGQKLEDIEVNIFGRASKNGEVVTIVGESKSQLSKKAVDEFQRKKVNRLKGVYDDMFTLLVTHMITSPEVEKYAREKGIALYYSYDF